MSENRPPYGNTPFGAEWRCLACGRLLGHWEYEMRPCGNTEQRVQVLIPMEAINVRMFNGSVVCPECKKTRRWAGAPRVKKNNRRRMNGAMG